MNYKGWKIKNEVNCVGHGDYEEKVYFIKNGICISCDDIWLDIDEQAKRIEKFLRNLEE